MVSHSLRVEDLSCQQSRNLFSGKSKCELLPFGGPAPSVSLALPFLDAEMCLGQAWFAEGKVQPDAEQCVSLHFVPEFGFLTEFLPGKA